MFTNYLTLAFRNLQKNLTFTIINTLGLCLGMTAFMMITQYIAFEKSYNAFHTNASSLYRVLHEKGEGQYDGYTAPGFAPQAASTISGIDQFCRLAEGTNLGTGVVSYENARGEVDKSFRENNFVYADAGFFGFFTFPVTEGNSTSLAKPNVVALSKKTSERYFGTEPAIGKTITLNNQFGKTLYTVEAVYEDMPEYSDLRYDMVFSIQTLYNVANLNGNEMWASMDGTGSQWLFTYVTLEPDANAIAVSDQYTKLERTANPEETSSIVLQPMADMHLGRSLTDPLPTFGSLKFVYLLGGIAGLILVIAWFNYINLSTASALKRAKEVGIRKVVGASRSQLIRQFLGESAMLNMIAFALAITLVTALQTPYANIIGKTIDLQILNNTSFWMFALAILVVGTAGSGAYTAFVLSSFNPSKVLKGVFSKSTKGVFVRKALVVFQFSISLMLIAATLILFQQWKFMQEKDLGMNAGQLLVIRGAEVNRDNTFRDRSAAFEGEINQTSFIQRFCRSGNVPGDGFNFSTSGITRLNPVPGDEKIGYNIITIDDRYLGTYEIELAAGQNFTPEMCGKSWNDIEYVIVNERAAGSLGFSTPEDAIGQKIKWEERELMVRGVIKDYHHLSVQYTIDPIIFIPARNGNYYTVKLAGTDIPSQLATLEKFYKKNFPGNPFEFQFLDQTFAAKYSTEQQYSIIFTVASCMAIFIGCLGLFGLAAYSVEQRTKEIGIRKVLGSSVSQIVSLFSKDFLALVVLAFIIAVPVSWWFMEQWLQGFAYRVTIGWWVFALSGIFTLFIAWVTVGTQAFKGAVSNPVSSLRSE
ncbi:MAG TPA: ABC transporter permease [Cyclobacteriaceae bacterium]|nr:ABC transporter permease [Cyclobacteriaceae bacterium]HMV08516.1 ABC transporter permease [Cyclobacteriaceae bacterium]HMV90004.1 ABC transporter permease [Cyclobacteriaceae bacterium]HMX01289.1 ABC transporter permease [Cyclobacteriaceae bacterium]HMX51297.1 ABC transporter permease [Cyclobacteriaceae bacterium]